MLPMPSQRLFNFRLWISDCGMRIEKQKKENIIPHSARCNPPLAYWLVFRVIVPITQSRVTLATE